MSTGCCLAIKLPDGSFLCSYYHFDGDDVGVTLKQNYNTEENAHWLINLGELRLLSFKTVEFYLDENDRQIEPRHCQSQTELTALVFEERQANSLYVFEDGQWQTHQ